jgi:NAD-dependent deacetylase
VADLPGLSGVPSADLERARSLLAEARAVVFLTGAGVSAESGVPTFRGAGGLWRNHEPESLATPEAFRRDPRLVWEWYAWRQGLVAACEPNPGHHAIAALVRRLGDARVVTQNVDGLHERAARTAAAGAALTPRERPLELHGSLFRVKCVGCAYRASVERPCTPVDPTGAETLPRCPACGALLRPDVVWFGEALDAGVLGEASRVASAADLCVVVGTSALVHPAASLPLLTLEGGGTLLEVNPARTRLSSACAFALQGPAGVILPALAAEP